MIPFWFLFIRKRWNMQTSTLRREQYIYWEIFLNLNELLIVHIFDMAAISFKTGFQAKAEILPDFLPSVISHFSGICLHVLLQLHQGTGLAGIQCTFWGFPEPEVQRVQVRAVRSALMLCSQADETIPKKSLKKLNWCVSSVWRRTILHEPSQPQLPRS